MLSSCAKSPVGEDPVAKVKLDVASLHGPPLNRFLLGLGRTIKALPYEE